LIGDVIRTASFVRVRSHLEERGGEQRTLIVESVEQIFPVDALAMPSGKSWG